MTDLEGGPSIEVDNLRYRYGRAKNWALAGISLRIEKGVVLGLVGPNGSGKTTLFRLVLGFARWFEGRIGIDGSAPAAYRTQYGIGYLPEQVRLPAGVRVRRLAEFAGRLAALDCSGARNATDRLMKTLAIDDRADERIGTLSHGYRQRVGLLVALLGDPQLILLDEPANGLDPESVGVLRSVLRGLKQQGRTVIVSSHNLLELERVCDAVVILSQGRVLGRSSRSELLSQPDVWVVQLSRDSGDAVSVGRLCAKLHGVRLAADEAGFGHEQLAREFAARASTRGCVVEAVERRSFDLEYLFHSLVQQGRQDEEAD